MAGFACPSIKLKARIKKFHDSDPFRWPRNASPIFPLTGPRICRMFAKLGQSYRRPAATLKAQFRLFQPGGVRAEDFQKWGRWGKSSQPGGGGRGLASQPGLETPGALALPPQPFENLPLVLCPWYSDPGTPRPSRHCTKSSWGSVLREPEVGGHAALPGGLPGPAHRHIQPPWLCALSQLALHQPGFLMHHTI